jgi:hypothetical protein
VAAVTFDLEIEGSAYKVCDLQKARTRVHLRAPRIGPVQYLVLEYALKVARTFMPSDVSSYALEKYGLELDRRRLHDAVKRLVERGYLVKLRRGWYRLSESADITPSDLRAVKDGRSKVRRVLAFRVGRGVFGFGSGVCVSFGRLVEGPVLRLHSCGCGSLERLYFELCFLRSALDRALESLEPFLRRSGFSKLGLSRLRRVARLLAQYLRVGLVGAHSRFNGGESRGLLPLRYSRFLRFRELGVDLLSSVPLPKMHLKVYVAPSPYS